MPDIPTCEWIDIKKPAMSITQEEIPALEICIEFLNQIGIKIIFKKIDEKCFLPGLYIMNGMIIIDIEKLKYPGDILHEGGHIAVVPAIERLSLSEESINRSEHKVAEEMMAIAWSYAACFHLKIDPCFVFHEEGYNGAGRSIIDNFKVKRYFGLPMLQWIGLTVDEKNAAMLNIAPYPNMIKWLRD